MLQLHPRSNATEDASAVADPDASMYKLASDPIRRLARLQCVDSVVQEGVAQFISLEVLSSRS